MPSAMVPRFTVGMNKRFGRRPCKEPVPFQEILPLELKNSLSGKGNRTSTVACLQEMAIFFACMKKNDFNQALCSKEIELFQSCYTNFQAQRDQKNSGTDDTLVGAKGKLPYQKVNEILKKYPQPK